MALTKKQEKALDSQIEALYYKLANGRQINIMKIGALFRDAKKSYLNGTSIEVAVSNAIATHCEAV